MSKEVILASEEVTRRNIKAVIEYSRQTRDASDNAKSEVESLKKMILQQQEQITLLKQQMSNLQIKIYSSQ